LKEVRIDVPLRSFQEGIYPNLIGLCKYFNIPLTPIDFSYSFSNIVASTTSGDTSSSRSIIASFIYNGASGRNGLGIPSRYFLPKNEAAPKSKRDAYPLSGIIAPVLFYIACLPSLIIYAYLTLHFLNSYLRWVFLSVPIVRAWYKQPEDESLREWADRNTPNGWFSRWLGADKSWRDFMASLIVPMFSCICTATREDIWDYPVVDILDFVWDSLGTSHYVTPNGTRDIQSKLVASLVDENVHLSTTITSIIPDPSDPTKLAIKGTHRIPESETDQPTFDSRFDHVILATHASAAAKLLKTYHTALDSTSNGSAAPSSTLTPQQHQRELVRDLGERLSTFIDRTSIIINHTDHRLLPNNVRDWRIHNIVDPLPGDEIALETDPNALTIVTDISDKRIEKDATGADDAATPRSRRQQGRRYTVTNLTVPPSYTMSTQVYHSPPTLTYSSDILLPIYTYPLAQVFQTTNPIIPPKKEKILSVTALDRGVPTVESKEAQKGLFIRDTERRWFGLSLPGKFRMGYLQGCGRGYRLGGDDSPAADEDTEGNRSTPSKNTVPGLWVCGSYTFPGIPLLEGCVESARQIVETGLMPSEGVYYRIDGWKEL
jgi:microfibrillar-associated protein 1